MNPLSEVIDTLGLASVWVYLALFLVSSVIMIWRLEALGKQGLEGTALGTLVMPYCSGLGNLVFVFLIAARGTPGTEVLTNCLVNNVTNLTLVLGLPTLFWGLQLEVGKKRTGSKKTTSATSAAKTEHRLNQLSLLLTLTAVVFFSGVTWALGADGRLDASDGLVLIALFLFWQCFQVFDVMKHNIRQRHSFGALFVLDVFTVMLVAYAQYASIDWLVNWVAHQKGGFINEANLGWLSGWLMVMPNALLAFFYAARRRADVAYSSQVGDAHICIPLCLGLSALHAPIVLPSFFEIGIGILVGAAALHATFVFLTKGLPQWMGWVLLAGYAAFLAAGFS